MSAKYLLHSACAAFATVARLERGSSVTFTLEHQLYVGWLPLCRRALAVLLRLRGRNKSA